MSHGDADHGAWIPRSNFYDQGRFGRLFPTLPPFAPDTPLVRERSTELGAPGGPMDAADDLERPDHAHHRPRAERRQPRQPD